MQDRKKKKKKGIGRLSASPAYAGEVGCIGDVSGVIRIRAAEQRSGKRGMIHREIWPLPVCVAHPPLL